MLLPRVELLSQTTVKQRRKIKSTRGFNLPKIEVSILISNRLTVPNKLFDRAQLVGSIGEMTTGETKILKVVVTLATTWRNGIQLN